MSDPSSITISSKGKSTGNSARTTRTSVAGGLPGGKGKANNRKASRLVQVNNVQHSQGEYPLLETSCPIIPDRENGKIYMVTSDSSDTSTEHVSSCDLKTMTWQDLTDRLEELKPNDPFLRGNLRARPRSSLPRRFYAGRDLLRIWDRNYLITFGGYNPVTETASSDIFIVDPQDCKWWRLNPDGGPVLPRIDPTIVAIGTKVYIFGGYSRFGDDPKIHATFNITEYVPDTSVWHWIVRDRPYPASVPPTYVVGRALSVYGGTRILLTPGRLTEDKPITLSNTSMFFYNIGSNKFENAASSITGSFPGPVSWYFLREPLIAPRKNSQGSHITPIYICAWVNVVGTDDLAPEIWELSFSQASIACLHVSRMIWNLDTIFEECCFSDSANTIRFLGAKAEGKKVGQKRKRLGSSSTDGGGATFKRPDEESSEDDDPRWNIYYDVPLLRK